jgi:membrane protein YqaA with SNARE-associated domain
VTLWAEPAKAAAKRAHSAHTLHWLAHLGAPGVFGVAVIDSSPIPLPIPAMTDLLLLWLVSHNGNPWLLTASAIAGAVLGGYIGWNIGHKGGEEALKTHVPGRMLDPVRRWAKGNPFLGAFLPALLPPPLPLTPFVFAAGALGVPRWRFLAWFGAARAIRYALVTWLGVTYGRRMIRVWSRTLDKWSTPILIFVAAVVIGGIVIAVVKIRRHRKSAPASEPASEPVRESAAD